MRPPESVEVNTTYECFACGARTTDPETLQCEDCGGELNNIGRPRDL